MEKTESLRILQIIKIFTVSLLLSHGKKTAPEIYFPTSWPGEVVVEWILCLKLETWEESEERDKTLITNLIFI